MPARSHERWIILAVLFLARTAMGFQFQSIAALSSFLLAEFRLDFTRLGLLIGLYLLPGVVIAYPGGLLGRRFGDKRIALVGMALMLVGGFLASVGHDYAMLFAGRLISGIGAVLLNVLLTKMTADWFAGREIGTALAILVSSWPIGIGIALIVLPLLAGAWSVVAALASTAVAAGLLLLLIAAIYRVPDAALPPPTGRSGFTLSRREIGLASLAGAVWMAFNVGYIVLVSFAPSLLAARGLSPGEAGFATSLAAWTCIATIPLGGLLVDRVGRANLLMVSSFAAFAFASALLPSMPSLVLLATIGALAGLPCGAMMALPTGVLRPQNRAAGMGVFYTWYYVGMAFLTPLAGLLRDATADPGAPLRFAGGLEIAALAFFGAFRLLEHRRVSLDAA